MLKITPINFDEANEFVRIHHRHHRPVIGTKFCVAVSDSDGFVRGVANSRRVTLASISAAVAGFVVMLTADSA